MIEKKTIYFLICRLFIKNRVNEFPAEKKVISHFFPIKGEKKNCILRNLDIERLHDGVSKKSVFQL